MSVQPHKHLPQSYSPEGSRLFLVVFSPASSLVFVSRDTLSFLPSLLHYWMYRRPIFTQAARMATTAPKKPSTVQPEWHVPVEVGPKAPVLKLYNSLTRTKNEFIPLKQGHISWYCCGPTVYDHSHMGHARNYVSTDINRRILQDYFGYKVKFVQNVTDIDDKIIIAARQAYLFEQKLEERFSEVTPELETLARGYLDAYVKKNLPQFTCSVESDFANWAASVDLQKEAVAVPKLPMYVKAAVLAHSTIYGKKTGIKEYFSAIRDVAVLSLDKQYGSSVTDPSIFRKLPYFWEHKFDQDMARLNVMPSSITTRVLEYVPEIIDFVDKIITNGFGYATSDGSVYFDTVRFENDPKHDYAKLQPWNKGSLELINDGEGSLTAEQLEKKNPADFALWKASKPGEPSWPSKWGEGRPGWHIECSVMASDITGETMDIHSGGVDLCFPHHDNELAQLEAYFDNKQWVNYFLHSGHLHIQGQKMLKSLKNFITIEQALEEFTARQLRLVFALSSWEKPIDFKDALIKEVRSYELTVSKFFTTVRALNNDYKHTIATGGFVLKKWGPLEKALSHDLLVAQDEVNAAFCDNLSSPQALRTLQELVSKVNNYIQAVSGSPEALRLEIVLDSARYITRILSILGFESRSDKLGWVDGDSSAGNNDVSKEDTVGPYVKVLSQFRDNVRGTAINKGEYSEILAASDALRSDLIGLGVSLDDRPNGAALVKFLNQQEQDELVQQQQAKEQALLEKEKKRQQQQEANLKREEERLAKMRISPKDMFREKTLYLEWDEQGIPTKDAQGEEVSKSMRKKLTKQHQQQEKLHAEYLKMQDKSTA